ncbi:MAG TPA: ribonuclease III domain-containing protein [Clostridia bacterium]
MIEEIFKKISQELPVKPGDINTYSPLALAYVGDAVYELYIRTLLLSRGNAPVHKLHRQSVAFVKAKAQSDIVHKLMERLDPVEQDVVRRGRNAKSGTIPKNADVADYKYATGFETLLGYLYIKQDFARLLEVLRISVEQSEADV